MTRGEFVFEISRAFGLDDTVGSDELKLMQRWYTRGVKDFLIKTRCYVDIGQMQLQANNTDYRIDSSVLVVDNITLPDTTGNPYPLEIVNMIDLLPYLGATVAPGAPTKAAIEGTLMRVAPAPSSIVTLTYVYVPKPTEVAADGTTTYDTIDPSTATYGGVPDEYHEGILAFMAWKAADYDDKTTALRVQDYRKGYEGLCTDTRKQHRRKSGRGMHAGRVGYPNTQGPSSRNDVYPRYTR